MSLPIAETHSLVGIWRAVVVRKIVESASFRRVKASLSKLSAGRAVGRRRSVTSESRSSLTAPSP